MRWSPSGSSTKSLRGNQMNAVVHLPAELRSLRAVHGALERLDLRTVRAVELDTTRCGFSEPFPLLYLGHRIRQLRRQCPDIPWRLRLPSRESRAFLGYASHIGFFDFCGFEHGKKVGEARGSSRHFPLVCWSIPEFRRDAGVTPLGAVVDDRAAELAEILLQSSSGPVFDIVQFSIRELARNAVEHSRGTFACLLAQYWPKSSCAEFAVFDDGVGIAENIYSNEYVDVSNNVAAIKVALLPGITGVPMSVRSQQPDRWNNSGFGLYMVSRLAARYGAFGVVSSGDYVRLTNTMQYHRAYPCSGTGVSLRFNLSTIEDPKRHIERLIHEGEVMRSSIMNDFPIAASAASKMLRSQFSKKVEG